jgi:hypothetical protein
MDLSTVYSIAILIVKLLTSSPVSRKNAWKKNNRMPSAMKRIERDLYHTKDEFEYHSEYDDWEGQRTMILSQTLIVKSRLHSRT